MKKRLRKLAFLLAAALTAGSLAQTGVFASETAEAAEEAETRTIVDASGKEVEVPAHPQAIVMLPTVLPNMVYALQGTGENLLAMTASAYKGYEISILKDMAPEIEGADTEIVGETVNLEALAAANPDLVFSWSTAETQAEQIRALGIPVVMLNSAKDIETLRSLIIMLGDALNCTDRADQFLSWYDETEDYFDSKAEQVAALSEEEKPRVLHFMYVEERDIYANGVNPYITELEGGQNIVLTGSSADTSQPTMEEILAYDPEIIFISNFDDVTPDDLYNNRIEGQDWSSVSAVKNHQVYKVPCGLYRWAPPNTIEKPLYMLWTASIVQPEIFSDIDIREEVTDFFNEFFSYELSEEQLDEILHTDLNQ